LVRADRGDSENEVPSAAHIGLPRATKREFVISLNAAIEIGLTLSVTFHPQANKLTK
jgi:hypothetical protein